MSKLQNLKKIKLIAFDLDGTLYPSNPKLIKKINDYKIKKISQKFDISPKKAQIKFNKLLAKYNSNTIALTKLGIDGHTFHTQVWQKIKLKNYIKLNPHLATILEKLKKNYQLAILTNSNTRKDIAKKLNLIGINPKLFDFFITSVEVGFNKPNPKIFQALVKTSKLKPEEILYIGDREKVDIIPAKKLGLKTGIIGKSQFADINLAKIEKIKNYPLN